MGNFLKPRLAGLFLVAALLVLAPYGSAQETTPAGNAENGKKLYNDTGCWQCHGYSGQGVSGPTKLAPDPISYPSFSRYTRKPLGSMPPYSPKVLSDAQMADIYAFLLTIPEPPDPDSIPLLKSE